jgi:hypothetical protein
MAKKPDAHRGHFAVTDALEAWAEEQKARRLRGEDGSKYETDLRGQVGGVILVPPSGETEVLSPVKLRPEDLALEASGFSMGVGVHQVVYRFKDIVAVEATEPWPTLEIEWRHPMGATRRRFEARFDKERLSWADTVEKLFAHLADRFPHVAKRGWLDAPEIEWERVDAFPDERIDDAAPRGGYRLSAREAPAEEIIARRNAPKALEAMMDWLASSPDYPWREHPHDVVVSVSHVYVRRRDENVYRLPVSALRVALTNGDDYVFVFGRRTRLLLPHRKDCEVLAALNAVLR